MTVKIDGNKKDKPRLSVDGRVYVAASVPADIYGTIGAFGQSPPASTTTRDAPNSS
jgi:hypothetical protein